MFFFFFPNNYNIQSVFTAARSIALFFELPVNDKSTLDEILHSLSLLDDKDGKTMYELLIEFKTATDTWFYFIQVQKKKYTVTSLKDLPELPDDIKSELTHLANLKDKAFVMLQSHFDNLQLKKFNIITFGKNIDGQLFNLDGEQDEK